MWSGSFEIVRRSDNKFELFYCNKLIRADFDSLGAAFKYYIEEFKVEGPMNTQFWETAW